MRTEAYLTEKNRDKKVKKWLSSIDRKRKWPSKSEKKALLILDMQKFFTFEESHAYVPSSKAIIPVISTVVEMFDGPIFLTRHVQKEDEENLMNQWWKDRIEGDPSELHPSIAGIEGEVIFKDHYSAFFDTDLERTLKGLQVDSLIITGVLTDLCCESTTRDAFMRGFKVYFIADGTATATEKRHIGTLRSISYGFGEVISSEELRSRS